MRTTAAIAALFLVLIAVQSANASGVNLRWSNCYGDGGVVNRTFACNTNSGINVLVASFALGSGLSQVSGNEIMIDIASAGAELPAWWAFKNAGTCRQSALTMNFVAPGTAVNCVDWALGTSAGGIAAYSIGVAGPNTARITAANAVAPDNLQDLVVGQEYFTFNLVISNVKTVGTACIGCTETACLVLSAIKVTTPDPANSVLLTSPANGIDSHVAMWQNSVPSAICAAVDSPAFTVTTSVLGRGTVSRAPNSLWYAAGTPLTLTAQPLPGDRFVAWSGDTTTTNAIVNVPVYRDLTYFATFERDPLAAPILNTVVDVPNDQGSSVVASWSRSSIDDAAFPGLICCYQLQRTLSADPGSPWVAASSSITATHASSYSKVATTPADSVTGDPAVRGYRVVATTSDGTAQWVSNIVDGYSVDNIAPPPPGSVSGVISSGTATLFWPAISVPDIAQYAIYRGLEPDPPADMAHRVGTTTGTNFTDSPGYFAYYRVTGVDRHGNESLATPFVPLNSVDVPAQERPRVFTVGNPFPLPMRSSMSLAVGLPHASPVTADVCDSQGRLVRQLANGATSEGWVTLSWDARDSRGHEAAPGIYFVRVRTSAGERIKRLVLIP